MKKYKVTIPSQNNTPQIFGICEHEDHIELGAYLSHDINAADIPVELSGKPVTVIGSDCFFSHEEISSVTFPETLTSRRFLRDVQRNPKIRRIKDCSP